MTNFLIAVLYKSKGIKYGRSFRSVASAATMLGYSYFQFIMLDNINLYLTETNALDETITLSETMEK